MAATQISPKSKEEPFPLSSTSEGSSNLWKGKLLSPAERLKSPIMEQPMQSMVKSVVLGTCQTVGIKGGPQLLC